MKKIVFSLIALMTFVGCKLNPEVVYYEPPQIENIAISHDLSAVTANDDIYISADVTNFFGRGFVCVKYWVCNNDWGETPPEMKFIADALYKWVEPQGDEEEGSWKKLASLNHTYTYTCPSCGNATLMKPSTCTQCSFKEDKEYKFVANNVMIAPNCPVTFEAIIPKQKAGKFVMFALYCTSEYGIYAYSDFYSYTVQP